MSDPLRGWKTCRLDEVCEIVNGGTPKTKVAEYWDGPHQWVTPAEMGKRESASISETQRTLSDEGLGNCSARLIPEGSVIMSSRAPIGHLVMNDVPMAFNQGCKGLVPGEDLDQRFLFYFLTANKQELDDLGTGATFKELSATKLKAVEIPLPPLSEQRRLVGLLDAAFAGLATATAHTQKNLTHARELFESELSAIFDTAPDHWTENTLGKICEIARGGSPRPIKAFITEEKDGVNWVKIGDATASEKYIYKTKQKIKPEGVQRSRMVYDGDFILSNSMSFGRPYIMRTTGAIHDGWLLLRDEREVFDQDFLYLFLSSHYAFDQLDRMAAGSVVRNLNTDSVRALRVRHPDRAEQRKVADALGRISEHSARLTRIAERKLASLEELKQSLLHRAFRGELSGGAAADIPAEASA